MFADFGVLDYDSVWSSEWSPAFRKKISPPSLGLKREKIFDVTSENLQVGSRKLFYTVGMHEDPPPSFVIFVFICIGLSVKMNAFKEKDQTQQYLHDRLVLYFHRTPVRQIEMRLIIRLFIYAVSGAEGV